jgi:hypothetical protein
MAPSISISLYRGYAEIETKNCGVHFSGIKVTIKIIISYFLANSSHATARLELIHADLCGRMEETSFSRARYLLLLKDDYYRKQFGYFLKAKSEVYKYNKSFILKAEVETGERLKCLRTDNGKSFVTNRSINFWITVA